MQPLEQNLLGHDGLNPVPSEQTGLLNVVIPGPSPSNNNNNINNSTDTTPEDDRERRKRKEERQRQSRMRQTSVFHQTSSRNSLKAKRHRERFSNDDNDSSNNNNAPATSRSPYKRDVDYDGENHMSVIFQIYGSVWPTVLPWCIATMLVAVTVWALRAHDIVDLTIASSTGHSFMSILVSFLIVTRTTITYNRFMEARQHLADLYRNSREIVHYTCVLTSQNTSNKAKQWRQEVAYRTIVSLRVAVAALEYRSKGVNTWEVIPEEEHEKTELIIDASSSWPEGNSERSEDRTASLISPASTNTAASSTSITPRGRSHRFVVPRQSEAEYRPTTDHFAVLKTLAHGPRTRTDENFRAPIVWAYNLREAILWPRKKNSKILAERPWHVNESLKLLALVSDFVAAYHELKKLVSTPFPFPLIQMTRTFLFFWVFTLPMVLAEDNDQIYEVLILMFFITYGFLGLEYVNMELDDPYGDDPNDFPGQRWAETVFEDVYIAIYKTDGFASAVALRSRISERTARGSPLENYRDDANTGFHLRSGVSQSASGSATGTPSASPRGSPRET